jgi:hypothetical protein
LVRSSYESQATFDRHFAAPEYAAFQATLKAEDIIDFKDPVDAEIRAVKHVAGFMYTSFFVPFYLIEVLVLILRLAGKET